MTMKNPHDIRVSDKWDPPSCDCLDDRDEDRVVPVHPHDIRSRGMKFPSNAGVTPEILASIAVICPEFNIRVKAVTDLEGDEEVYVQFTDDLEMDPMCEAIDKYQRGHHPAGPC